MAELSEFTNDQLADEITTWAGRVAAGEAHLLALIAEFDRREAWGGPGMLSCAHWLSWRTGLSAGAARERVRVARAVQALPVVWAAFSAGAMSWSQVRAVTRVASPEDGVDWVDLAAHTSATQLERIARGLRRAQRVEERAADPELAAYELRTRTRYDADGNLVITIHASAEQGAVILAGLEAQRAELDRQRAQADATNAPDVPAGTSTDPTPDAPAVSSRAGGVPAGTSKPPPLSPAWAAVPGATPEGVAAAALSCAAYFASLQADETASTDSDEHLPEHTQFTPTTTRQPDVPAETPGPDRRDDEAPERSRATDADALLALARTALDDQRAQHPDIARRTRSRLTAQVDPLSGWGRLADGELLPPTSLAAVLKTLPGRAGALRLRPLTAADRTRLDLGRTSRDASQALRELLGCLDGERCRFPGCTRHKKLHAHHVVYWSDGGPTDLSNLVLVCSRHHTLIHSQGFRLILHPDRRLSVATAEGVPVLHHPAQPWGDPAALDPTGRIHAGTLPPTNADTRMDLGYVVSVLLQQAA